MDGEVIGVNSQIATSTGDYNGIGFALPSNEAANVYRQIRDYGKVRRGYFGVSLDSVKTEFAKVYGLAEARGAIVTNVSDRKSAAALAGLQAGDIILEFNGEKVASAPDLVGENRRFRAGKRSRRRLSARGRRGARTQNRGSVKLCERPPRRSVADEDSCAEKTSVSDTKKPVEPLV
jgi:serine protease Do